MSLSEENPGETAPELPIPEVTTDGKLIRPFPTMIDFADFVDAAPPLPSVLIEGIVHRGHKLLIGGTSKSKKTWTLLDLAISVATGTQWLGQKTTQGKVLYVDFELSTPFIAKRSIAIAKTKNVSIREGVLKFLSLRGFAASHDVIIPKVREMTDGGDFSLIAIDPLYKLLGGKKENAAEDMAEVFNSLERLAVESGATAAAAHHFAKGSAAGKDAQDRMSGSGVLARDPDAVFVMTPHEDPECFTCETILRNFPSLDPFVIRWDFPVMKRDDTMDPAQIKQPKGRPSRYDASQLLTALGTGGLTANEWSAKVREQTGMSRAKFFDLKREITGKKVIMNQEEKWHPIASVQ